MRNHHIVREKFSQYVEIMMEISLLGLPVMAERGGRVGESLILGLNPDFRPCVEDSDHRYLLLKPRNLHLGVLFGVLHLANISNKLSAFGSGT